MHARFFTTMPLGLVALFFAGCAAVTGPGLTGDNPANPDASAASEATVTPAAQVLQSYKPASRLAPGGQSQTNKHKSNSMKNMTGGDMSMPQGGGQ